MKNILIISLCILSLFACKIAGINIKHETPKHAGKYPHFKLSDSLHGYLNSYRSCYDVTFYSINIDVDIKEHYLKGYVDCYFKATKDFNTLQLDLYENMKINSITYGNKTLKFSRNFKAVFVSFDEDLKTGNNYKITINYEGKPIDAPRPPWEGGFVWKKDNNKKPWIGVACELDGASLWWPVKDHLSDEPDSLQMNITIPKGLEVVSNGKLISRTVNNDKETFNWKTLYPINTYCATIYIGDFTLFTIPYENMGNKFPLDFYVLPSNLEKAKTHFKQVTDILKFYESIYGEYPWKKENYKLVEAPFEGMEHQSAIAYGSGFSNFNNYNFDYIILHETAHEWWGNSISAGDYAEVWLHESFATFSEALYIEHVYGYEAYQSYLNFYAMLIKNSRPIEGPMDVNYWDYKDTDVYMKGALMLHSLRNTINNDSIFFDIIKSFYNKKKYSVVTSKDFIDMVSGKTKENYNWFFDQYLYSRYVPQLEFNFYGTNDNNYSTIVYKWNDVKNDFKMPITIKYGDNKTVIITPTKEIQSTQIEGARLEVNIKNSYINLKQNKKLH